MKTHDYKVTTSDANDVDLFEIVIEGDLSFNQAGRILKVLRSLKIKSSKVILTLKNVAKLDITILQTVRVFKNELWAKGKTLKVVAELGEETQRLLNSSGFSTIL